jgi:glycosyltransferase involved in cell wall biosynthesis
MSASNSQKPDVSAVLTAHAEGILLGATLNSAREAIDHLQQSLGKTTEIILVLDNADELTKQVAAQAIGDGIRMVESKLGDPGQARNFGIEHANADHSCFLDGDDLWSFNWLTEAYKFSTARPDAIGHSHCNITFGDDRSVWWHVDSESPLCDDAYLEWANYWDAMTFAPTEIYRKYKFKKNDLKTGFAHEDWHWNRVTLAAGVPHKPVPDTMHFKRRRGGSVSAIVADKGATVWPV